MTTWPLLPLLVSAVSVASGLSAPPTPVTLAPSPVTASVSQSQPAALSRGAVASPSGLPGRASAHWLYPLAPRPRVVARFSAPSGPYAAGHRGVDLTSAVGSVVHAPTGGTVSFSGVVAGRHVLVVSHPGGLRSTFEPVSGTVPVGTVVEQGGDVGTVDAGAGHCSPATCVHWGVLRGATYLDPLQFVRSSRVILLPLTP
ncbi:peptidoglycan DD-metalloendopeptidase family protein [Dermatophilaceae bacterium Soc4.6]